MPNMRQVCVPVRGLEKVLTWWPPAHRMSEHYAHANVSLLQHLDSGRSRSTARHAQLQLKPNSSRDSLPSTIRRRVQYTTTHNPPPPPRFPCF